MTPTRKTYKRSFFNVIRVKCNATLTAQSRWIAMQLVSRSFYVFPDSSPTPCRSSHRWSPWHWLDLGIALERGPPGERQRRLAGFVSETFFADNLESSELSSRNRQVGSNTHMHLRCSWSHMRVSSLIVGGMTRMRLSVSSGDRVEWTQCMSTTTTPPATTTTPPPTTTPPTTAGRFWIRSLIDYCWCSNLGGRKWVEKEAILGQSLYTSLF